MQFLASSGWLEAASSHTRFLSAAHSSLLVDDFCCRTGSGWEYVGFSGGGFDEVRLQDFSVPSNFDLTRTQALALDNISAVAEVLLPAALPLFASGLGVLGVLGSRRKRKLLP